MRQPIQRRLIALLLSLIVLVSAFTAVISAWFSSQAARRAEHERLQQLVSTLVNPGFPLTDAVLHRMANLSGADFVTLNSAGHVQQASREIVAADATQLGSLQISSSHGPLTGDQPLRLSWGAARAVRLPIRTLSEGSSLVILTSQQRWNELAWRAMFPPLIAGLLAATLAGLLAVIVARQLVFRIQQLAIRAGQLASGDFKTRLLPSLNDELRDLAAALNTTAEKLELYEQRVRAGERLQTLGRLGAGMAHQLRNAITGARMALDLHQAEHPTAPDDETLSVAVRQLRLMESYLQRFLTVGRSESPTLREVELRDLINDVLQLTGPLTKHHGIGVDWRSPPNAVVIRGDDTSLRQMLLNLLMNAIEAVQSLPAAERHIGIELGPEFDSGEIRLRILDGGPGPAEHISALLFERFVTDKPDGTGLGLSVAQEVAQSHGGRITWQRDHHQTVFEITLAARRDRQNPVSAED